MAHGRALTHARTRTRCGYEPVSLQRKRSPTAFAPARSEWPAHTSLARSQPHTHAHMPHARTHAHIHNYTVHTPTKKTARTHTRSLAAQRSAAVGCARTLHWCAGCARAPLRRAIKTTPNRLGPSFPFQTTRMRARVDRWRIQLHTHSRPVALLSCTATHTRAACKPPMQTTPGARPFAAARRGAAGGAAPHARARRGPVSAFGVRLPYGLHLWPGVIDQKGGRVLRTPRNTGG